MRSVAMVLTVSIDSSPESEGLDLSNRRLGDRIGSGPAAFVPRVGRIHRRVIVTLLDITFEKGAEQFPGHRRVQPRGDIRRIGAFEQI